MNKVKIKARRGGGAEKKENGGNKRTEMSNPICKDWDEKELSQLCGDVVALRQLFCHALGTNIIHDRFKHTRLQPAGRGQAADGRAILILACREG